MSLNLSIEIEGEKQLSAELLIAAGHIKDFSLPLAASAQELIKSFDMNFDRRGAMFGGWVARKKNYPWPLMEKTGRLRGGFYSHTGKEQAVVGNAMMDAYGKYHQSNQSRRKMPRRVFMEIDEARRNYIIKAFQRHIVESTRGLS